MENSRGLPWGAQDALQVKRGLTRAITPNYVAVGSEHSCLPPQERKFNRQVLQHQSDTRQQGDTYSATALQLQHPRSNKKHYYCRAEEHEYELPMQSQSKLDKHLPEGRRPHTSRQPLGQQKVHQPSGNPVHPGLRLQYRQESTLLTPSGQHRASDYPPWAAGTAVAGGVSTAGGTRADVESLAKALEQRTLQRCSSCPSTQPFLQRRCAEAHTTLHDRQDLHQHLELHHSRREQPGLAQAGASPHPHQLQQHYVQQKHHQQSSQLGPWCCQPGGHDERQHETTATLQKSLSGATTSVSPPHVGPCAWNPVPLKCLQFHMTREEESQEQSASDSICERPFTGDGGAAHTRTPQPDGCGRALAATAAASVAQLDTNSNVSAPVTAAAASLSTAFKPEAAVIQPSCAAPIRNATPPAAAEEDTGSLIFFSRRQPSGKSKHQAQRQGKVFSPAGLRLRQQLPKLASAGESPAAPAAGRVQAPSNVIHVSAEGETSGCSRPKSRTYAAFCEIAAQLIRQQQLLQRNETAALVRCQTPSDFRSAEKARDKLQLRTRYVRHVMAKGATTPWEIYSGIRPATAGAPSGVASSNKHVVSAATTAPTAGNQHQNEGLACIIDSQTQCEGDTNASVAIKDSASLHTQEHPVKQYGVYQRQSLQQARHKQQQQPLLCGQRGPFYGTRLEDSAAFLLDVSAQQTQTKTSQQTRTTASSSVPSPTACGSRSTTGQSLPEFPLPPQGHLASKSSTDCTAISQNCTHTTAAAAVGCYMVSAGGATLPVSQGAAEGLSPPSGVQEPDEALSASATSPRAAGGKFGAFTGFRANLRSCSREIPQLALLSKEGGIGSSGVSLRTCVDISSYSLGSKHLDAVRDRKTAAVAPGPLVLLFAFYSRVFSHLREGDVSREMSVPQRKFCLRDKFLKTRTVRCRSGHTPQSKGRGGSSNCSTREHANGGTSQIGSNGKSECVGISKASKADSTTGDSARSADAHNSCGKYENSNRSSLRLEGSISSRCTRCRLSGDHSAGSGSSFYAPLNHLLHDPVSFAEPCFGLIEAQEMVEHLSRHIPPFSLPPTVVEELWVLILLITNGPRAASADNALSATECPKAPLSKAEEHSLMSFTLPLSRTCSANGAASSVALVKSPFRAPLRAASVTGASRSRPIAVDHYTLFPSARPLTAAALQWTPLSADSEVGTTPIQHHVRSSSATLLEDCSLAEELLLNGSCRQLQKKRVNFLGFTAFFAAAVTLATRSTAAVPVFLSQSGTSPSASSGHGNAQVSASAIPVAGSRESISAGAADEKTPAAAPLDGQSVVALPAATGFNSGHVRAAASEPAAEAPRADARQNWTTLESPRRCTTENKNMLVNFRCLKQFMHRFGSARAVKRFLLEVYKELRTRAETATELKQKNARSPSAVRQSIAGDVGRISNGAQTTSRHEAARTRSATATATVSLVTASGSIESGSISAAAHTPMKGYVEVGKGLRSIPRRKTEEIPRHSAGLHDLVGVLPQRSKSDAAVVMKGAAYGHVLFNSTSPWTHDAERDQASAACPIQRVLFRSSDDIERVAAIARGGGAPLLQPAAPSEPRQRHHNARLSYMTAHPVRYSLWSVLPDSNTLKWLLQHYTFSDVTPIWLPFDALFIDMGVHQGIIHQQCGPQAQLYNVNTLHREGGKSRQPREENDKQRTQQQRVLTDPKGDGAAHDSLQAAATTRPEKSKCRSFLSDKIGFVGGNLCNAGANEGHREQQVAHESSVPGVLSARSPANSACGVLSVGSKGASGGAATDGATVACRTTSAVGKDAVTGTALTGETLAARIAVVAAKTCSRRDVAFAAPVTGGSASFAVPSVTGTISEPQVTCISVGVNNPRTAAPSDDSLSAPESSHAASSCGNAFTGTAAAGGSTLLAPDNTSRAAFSAPLQADNRTQQQSPSPAYDKDAVEESPAATTPAADEAQLSVKELPPACWQLMQQRAAHQRRQLLEHAATLQRRAIRQARRHRFAIEAKNKTTAPVRVVVDLENLPPVRAAQGSRCGSPVLLAPGCSKCIILDVDCTHDPGEWLGFAHVRLRSHRKSSTSHGGSKYYSSSSGECGSSERRSRRATSSTTWASTSSNMMKESSNPCTTSKSTEGRASSRWRGPDGEALRELSSTEKHGIVSSGYSSKQGGNHSVGTMDSDSGSDSGAFWENVASIPVYLQIVSDQTDQPAAHASEEPLHAAAEPQLPVVAPSFGAAALAGASASSAATGKVPFAGDTEFKPQKSRGQRRARALSPLPAHANRVSVAAALGCTCKPTSSPSAPCSMFGVHGELPGEMHRRQPPCRQEHPRSCHHQQELPQLPKQKQTLALKRAASATSTLPSPKSAAPLSSGCQAAQLQTLKCASSDNVSLNCISSTQKDCRQAPRSQTESSVRLATSYAQRMTDFSSIRSRSSARNCSSSDVSISVPVGSTGISYAGHRPIERSRVSDSTCQGGKDIKSNSSMEKFHKSDSGIDKENSKDASSSSGEDRQGEWATTQSAETSTEPTDDVCVSPSPSVSSCSSEEAEADWRAEIATKTVSATLSTGQRLNAREYSFAYRRELLERLQQAVPDCYHLGQQLLREQRLLRQRRKKYHSDNSQQQDKEEDKHQPEVDRQQHQCERMNRRRPEGPWPKHQHIRWLRGHLLYGKDPLERKGWSSGEATAAAATAAATQHGQQPSYQGQQRQKIAAVSKEAVQRTPAKEATKTVSPPTDDANGDSFLNGKLPYTASLFYYDGGSGSAFRCGGCGLSYWGKYKRATEEDPLTALRNIREEELREASTASCSTSTALPWALPQL